MQGRALTWSKYVEVLHARFDNELFGDPMLEMKILRQEGSFVDYQGRLNTLLDKIQLIDSITEQFTLSQFIGDLVHHLHARSTISVSFP